MPRTPLVAALLMLAACTVERTPDDVLNPRDPSQVERRDAEQDIAARVGAFLQAANRGNQRDAVEALLPLGDAHVIGVDGNEGRPRFGAEGLAAALREITIPPNAIARTPDLRVQADPRQGLAWFAGHVEWFPAADGAQRQLRMSGVFGRREGDWRLVQIHFSRPEARPAPAAARDSSRTDSATARDSAARNPASAAAPPAGG